MRVLIYQQFHPGHHYRYLVPLIPALKKLGCDVTVAVTPEGRQSREFETFLSPFQDTVVLDSSLPSGLPRMVQGQHWQLHTDVRETVKRHRPDHVLIPSGDPHTGVMGLFRITGLGALPGHIPVEIGIHWGRGSEPLRPKERVKDWQQTLKLRVSGCRRLHLVNFLFFERLIRRHDMAADRCVLMPQPVLANPRLSQHDSRVSLALPIDGRLLCLVGALDQRKAIPETIRAFRSALERPDDRLVIAGSLHREHLDFISNEAGDLITRDQLIVRDGFLSEPDYATYLTASDAVCLPYLGFTGLSAVLFEAIAAGRPVVGHSWDWSEALIKRFGLGWTCDVGHPVAYASCLRDVLSRCGNFVETPGIQRLLVFNSTENFAASWLELIASRIGAQGAFPRRSWEWVMEAAGPATAVVKR
jgi:glycosyltransferase involved in cell wall biosynthesis